jgi:hypothetical protein
MQRTISNAFIGSAFASAAATGLLVVQWAHGPLGASLRAFRASALEQLAIDFGYLWCGATLAAILYGAFAVKWGIYGRGAVRLENWKNALLGILILAVVMPVGLLAQAVIGASDDTLPWFLVAIALAMSISDACASSARRRRG